MKLSGESKSLINQTILGLIKRYSDLEDSVVTDLYFQPSFEDGELKVFDDEDEMLSSITINELVGLRGSDSMSDVIAILRRALDHNCKELEQLSILKPFSFVLVDQDKETVAELLLVDDDLVLADEGLLKGLDKELDEFLKNLLED